MDAAIWVAIVSGVFSLSGLALNITTQRRQDKARVRQEEKDALESQPDKAVARLVESLTESEKQAERTAKRLQECETYQDQLRVEYRKVLERNEDLEHENRRLHRSLDDARLETETLKRGKK